MAEVNDPKEIFRIVLKLSDSTPDKADLLANCGAGFLLRSFHDNNQKKDVDNCILAYESAIHLTQGHSHMSGRMNMLQVGLSYNHSFYLTGELSDISKAILYQQKAIHLTPEGHADMPGQLNDLGMSLQSRFEHTGDLADISNAISYQHKAIHLTPEGHADMHRWMNDLGNSFLRRFQNNGDLADISDAISYQQKAVHLTPEDHEDMPSRQEILLISPMLYHISRKQLISHLRAMQTCIDMNSLGNSFLCRFQCNGDIGDISNAISYQQRAVHLTPEGYADMPGQLNNLGTSFQSCFEHTGGLADISNAIIAISCQQKVVHFTPEGHANMSSCMNNLGNSFTNP